MATLKRGHTPMPWGAQVEQMVWVRSKRGKPRRRRADRPSLTHEPRWDWDGTRVLFGETMSVPELEDDDDQSWEDGLGGRPRGTVSLLDAARYRVTKRCRKARFGVDDFEVIRIPKVVPMTEREPGLWDGWELDGWEKVDAVLKRTYSEVAQGLVEGRSSPNTSGFSERDTEDDGWECL